MRATDPCFLKLVVSSPLQSTYSSLFLAFLCGSTLFSGARATTTTTEDFSVTTTAIDLTSASSLVVFTLTHLDYELLRADGAKQAALASALKSSIASLVVAVSSADVSIEFARGSVAVTASVSPPPGTLLADVQAQLASSISSRTFEYAILEAVNSVPNIQSLASGTIGVSGISASWITTTTVAPDTFFDWVLDLGPMLLAISALMCVFLLLLCGAACWGCKHSSKKPVRSTKLTSPTAAKYSEDCCIKRMPRIGETVYTLEAAEVADDEDGNPNEWRLNAEEPATVIEVDPDGDFRLRNPEGCTSGWQFRKFFRYPPLEEWELELPENDHLQVLPRASTKTRMPSSRGSSKMPRALVDTQKQRPVTTPRAREAAIESTPDGNSSRTLRAMKLAQTRNQFLEP